MPERHRSALNVILFGAWFVSLADTRVFWRVYLTYLVSWSILVGRTSHSWLSSRVIMSSSDQIPSVALPAAITRMLRGQWLAGVFAACAVMLTMLLVTNWVWQHATPLGFNDDAAQTLSTAAQWQKGEGLTTTVLYYDSQLDQFVPAAQTVWPPALPVLTATLSDLTGLSLSRSLVALLLLAHLLTAVGIGCVAVMASRRGSGGFPDYWWIGTATAFFWMLCAPALLAVARGLSEPLYMAFTALALIALCLAVSTDETPIWQRPASRQWPWLVGASAAVTAALLTRYQAVALLVPLAMACTLAAAPGTALAKRIRVGAAVTFMPLLALAVMFWRNWSLTGSLTGGAKAAYGQSLSEIAARLTWVPAGFQQAVLWGLLTSMLLAGLLAMVLWVRGFNSCRSAPAQLSRRTRVGVVFCLSAYAANLALLVALGLMSSVYGLELRYLTVNLLLLLLPVIVVLQQLGRRLPSWLPSVSPAALGSLVVLGLLLQMLAFKPVVEDRLAAAPPMKIAKVMSTPLIEVDGSEVKVSPLVWLAAQPTPVRLLSANAQSLALVLHAYDVPMGAVFGLPLPVFTDRNWDNDQVANLVDRQAIDFVVGFRRIPTWVYSDPLDSWIQKTDGAVTWLDPISATPDFFLGKIHKPVNSSLCGPFRSDKLLTIVAHYCD